MDREVLFGIERAGEVREVVVPQSRAKEERARLNREGWSVKYSTYADTQKFKATLNKARRESKFGKGLLVKVPSKEVQRFQALRGKQIESGIIKTQQQKDYEKKVESFKAKRQEQVQAGIITPPKPMIDIVPSTKSTIPTRGQTTSIPTPVVLEDPIKTKARELQEEWYKQQIREQYKEWNILEKGLAHAHTILSPESFKYFGSPLQKGLSLEDVVVEKLVRTSKEKEAGLTTKGAFVKYGAESLISLPASFVWGAGMGIATTTSIGSKVASSSLFKVGGLALTGYTGYDIYKDIKGGDIALGTGKIMGVGLGYVGFKAGVKGRLPEEMVIQKVSGYRKEEVPLRKVGRFGVTKQNEWLFTEEIKTDKIPIIKEGDVEFQYVKMKQLTTEKGLGVIVEQGWGVKSPKYQKVWTDKTLETGIPELWGWTETKIKPSDESLLYLEKGKYKPSSLKSILKKFKDVDIQFYKPDTDKFLKVSAPDNLPPMKPFDYTDYTQKVVDSGLRRAEELGGLIIPKEAKLFPKYKPIITIKPKVTGFIPPLTTVLKLEDKTKYPDVSDKYPDVSDQYPFEEEKNPLFTKQKTTIDEYDFIITPPNSPAISIPKTEKINILGKTTTTKQKSITLQKQKITAVTSVKSIFDMKQKQIPKSDTLLKQVQVTGQVQKLSLKQKQVTRTSQTQRYKIGQVQKISFKQMQRTAFKSPLFTGNFPPFIPHFHPSGRGRSLLGSPRKRKIKRKKSRFDLDDIVPASDWLSLTMTESKIRGKAHHPYPTPKIQKMFRKNLFASSLKFPTAEMLRGKKPKRKKKRRGGRK